MKRLLMKVSAIALLSTTSLSNTSCDDPCLNQALADLISDAVPVASSVLAGNLFELTNFVKNVKDFQACKTETAGETETNMYVEYSLRGNDYRPVGDINFDVPPIDAGMQAQEDYNFKFSDPGHYRIVTTADDEYDVSERNENNNQDFEGGTGVRTEEPGIIIQVVENPNMPNGRTEGEPYVEITRKSVTIIPMPE